MELVTRNVPDLLRIADVIYYILPHPPNSVIIYEFSRSSGILGKMPGSRTTSLDELQHIAGQLSERLRAVLAAVEPPPQRPTPLANRLKLSRVTVSRLLTALGRTSPFEMLDIIPGPESLRVVTAGAKSLGVDPRLISEADETIDQFSTLIRDRFGTRAALKAAIVGPSVPVRNRVELAGRADVFKGMRQIVGVEAQTWLTSMFFVPSSEDPEVVAVTTIHGALGMKRLRSDRPVYFTFGPPKAQQGSTPQSAPSNGPGSMLSSADVPLADLYANAPAQLETTLVGGQICHQLQHDRLGKREVVDMLAVSENPRGSRRFAAPGAPLRGVSVFVDIPVRQLLCDAIVHRDVFPDSEPELMVYDPGAKGPANPNDRLRDMDRIDVSDIVTQVAANAPTNEGDRRFEVAGVPNYARMIERVCQRLKLPSSEFRVYRLRMSYPVHGFQSVIAFRAPEAPAK